MVEEKIVDLLDAKFSEPSFSDCFLIDLQLHANRKLEIFIDSDSGVTFEKCQQISRYLESYLDTEGWLGDDYTLEVSSPGASRPLKFLRQYPKHLGRTLEISLADGEVKKGVLKAVSAEVVSLEEEQTVKDGKKKKKIVLLHEIPFDQIKQSIIKVSF
ncbi:MAG: ribosome maturation factor [Lewinellaceae bacterium]|nr:ribosome maturation factor [Lewinella sp.]MCB9277746.1 ribosome maturation factor [Lewinellaceae bacterium]